MLHMTTCERYYTTIVGGKKELLSMEHKYSGAVCELIPSI